jgi:Cu/Ag efflux protein CusF
MKRIALFLLTLASCITMAGVVSAAPTRPIVAKSKNKVVVGEVTAVDPAKNALTLKVINKNEKSGEQTFTVEPAMLTPLKVGDKVRVVIDRETNKVTGVFLKKPPVSATSKGKGK